MAGAWPTTTALLMCFHLSFLAPMYISFCSEACVAIHCSLSRCHMHLLLYAACPSNVTKLVSAMCMRAAGVVRVMMCAMACTLMTHDSVSQDCLERAFSIYNCGTLFVSCLDVFAALSAHTLAKVCTHNSTYTRQRTQLSTHKGQHRQICRHRHDGHFTLAASHL